MSFFHDPNAGSEHPPDPQKTPFGEQLAAPFRVIADFREAIDGWQFTNLPDREHPERCWSVPVEYRYLKTADYTVPELSVFVARHTAHQLLATLRHWPESFAQERAELSELQAGGASCLIVIEGDPETIGQVLKFSDLLAPWYPSALHSTGGDIPWLVAESQETAEQAVFEIMHRAWQRFHAQDSKPGE